MKRTLAFILVLSLMLPLAACGGESEPTAEPDVWGLELSAKDISPTGMTLLVHRSGGELEGDIQTGSFLDYRLQLRENDKWTNVPVLQSADSTAELCIIAQDSEFEQEINWEPVYGEPTPGRYRFVKDFFTESGAKETYYAEFVIE